MVRPSGRASAAVIAVSSRLVRVPIGLPLGMREVLLAVLVGGCSYGVSVNQWERSHHQGGDEELSRGHSRTPVEGPRLRKSVCGPASCGFTSTVGPELPL